jgi:hypothetical protein
MHLFGLEIHRIYLIDYFNEQEREANDVGNQIRDFLIALNLDPTLMPTNSVEQFFAALETIQTESDNRPILVFLIGHASRTGIGNNLPIGNPNRISLDWARLTEPLRRINRATANQLILDMMVPCFGYQISTINQERNVYHGMFGANSEQSRDIVPRCNNIYRYIVRLRETIEHMIAYTNHLCGEVIYLID